MWRAGLIVAILVIVVIVLILISMKNARIQKISMLELRHNLTDISNQVLFQGKKFMVIKNGNEKMAFMLMPLDTQGMQRRMTAEEAWNNLIDRSRLKPGELERIRIKEKKSRKY